MIESMDELILDQIYSAMLDKCPKCGNTVFPPSKQVSVCTNCGCVGLSKEFHSADHHITELN